MADSNKIGKYELTALIVGATIGSGIFGVNSDLANAAAPGPVILGWLIVGMGVWCLIAALNHLLLRYPKQAGFMAGQPRLCPDCDERAGNVLASFSRWSEPAVDSAGHAFDDWFYRDRQLWC